MDVFNHGGGAIQPIHGLLRAIFLLLVDELGEANAITSFHEGELIGMLRVSGLWLVLRPYGDRNSGRKGFSGLGLLLLIIIHFFL